MALGTFPLERARREMLYIAAQRPEGVANGDLRFLLDYEVLKGGGAGHWSGALLDLPEAELVNLGLVLVGCHEEAAGDLCDAASLLGHDLNGRALRSVVVGTAPCDVAGLAALEAGTVLGRKAGLGALGRRMLATAVAASDFSLFASRLGPGGGAPGLGGGTLRLSAVALLSGALSALDRGDELVVTHLVRVELFLLLIALLIASVLLHCVHR